MRNCNCSYYNNNVQPICTCFTVTHFHKLFSSFWSPKEKMPSGFAIRHPGQCRVPLLVLCRNPHVLPASNYHGNLMTKLCVTLST
jgi:hypothetical protein